MKTEQPAVTVECLRKLANHMAQIGREASAIATLWDEFDHDSIEAAWAANESARNCVPMSLDEWSDELYGAAYHFDEAAKALPQRESAIYKAARDAAQNSDAGAILYALGFEFSCTGGNCYAWTRQAAGSNGLEIYVTAREGALAGVGASDKEWMAGIFSPEGDSLFDTEDSDIPALLETLRAAGLLARGTT